MRTVVMIAKVFMYTAFAGACVFLSVLGWNLHRVTDNKLNQHGKEIKGLTALIQEQTKASAAVVVSETLHAKSEVREQAIDDVRNLLLSMLPPDWRGLNNTEVFWKQSKLQTAEFADVGIFQYQPDGKSHMFAVLPFHSYFNERGNWEWRVMRGHLEPSAEIVNTEGAALPREALIALSGKLVAVRGRFLREDQGEGRVLFRYSRLELKQLSY